MKNSRASGWMREERHSFPHVYTSLPVTFLTYLKMVAYPGAGCFNSISFPSSCLRRMVLPPTTSSGMSELKILSVETGTLNQLVNVVSATHTLMMRVRGCESMCLVPITNAARDNLA